MVGFHGVKLDATGVAVLGRMHRLQHVELFGTGLGEQEISALANKLPDARIEVRKGGKLGVGAVLDAGGPCRISTIEPGSAADQAGIRAGDVIVSVDGTPVADFEGLTSFMSGRGPGETVRLTLDRGGAADGDTERLDVDVRLDTW
jgi:S1-C subfamily serine protease